MRSGTSSILLTVIDAWRRPTGWRLYTALVLLVGLLLGVGWIVYTSGGTKYVYPHLMYIPVVLAALWFNVWGGIAVALLAGLVVGPYMPLNVATGDPQALASWLLRMSFFALIGALVGQMSSLLNLRLDRLHGALDSLSVTYAQTLKSFASLVALRDEQTGGHCERVAHNACVVGEALKLSKTELDALHWTGILHDLGKVATPAHILLKPGKLTPEEYAEIQKHAVVGAELLASVSNDFAAIAVGVRSHHERWDGTGYPDGLKGEAIPLAGRIMAVVDVFEALTSKRPYREPLPPDEALALIKQDAGMHFDPALVAVFEAAYKKGRIYVSGRDAHMTEFDAPTRLGDEVIAA